jgi:serine/threonine-protein kinase RsbW
MSLNTMAQSQAKTWTIPSIDTAAGQVLQEIVEVIEQHDFQRETVFALRLALDEALVNAVKHGNDNDPEKKVLIELSVDPDAVVIQIEDEGSGFKPDALPDPTAEENLILPHGRGVMLMRAYMTEVDFSERGNRVILTKRRDCKRPHAE